ncbi:MAG TPA: hypothetical protein ENJ18_07965 [Nannocystis exedens]|nr:hypothetical protein [Nannocystis exedens]
MLRVSFLALALALALVPACKPRVTATDDAALTAAAPSAAPISLPKPHPLEQSPAVAAYVRDPAAAHRIAVATLPGVPPPSNVAALLLATKAPADLAEALAPMIAEGRPWAGARVAGEDILHLPLRPTDIDAAQAKLAAFPPAGDFGAVSLPGVGIDVHQLAADQSGDIDLAEGSARDNHSTNDNRLNDSSTRTINTQLAWIDRETASLTIAETLPGLVTGRELVKGYASHPVWLTIDASVVREFLEAFPYERITAQGPGLDNLTITIDADPERGLPQSGDLAPGALANLHSGRALALAASTRYAHYEPEIRAIIREIRRQVDSSGFAAKMMLDPLAQQAITVLRAWNGRVFAGIGPSSHLAFAFGADDPRHAGAALNRFLRSAIDNLDLARMFVSNVPKLSLRRHSKSPDIRVLTVQGIKKQLPAGLAGLTDDRGAIKIAYSYSAKSGSVFAVLGAQPETALAIWARDIEGAPPASESTGDLIAATVALSPAQLQDLLGRADPDDFNALLAAGINLGAGRAPTQLIVRQEPDRYVMTSNGPALEQAVGSAATAKAN